MPTPATTKPEEKKPTTPDPKLETEKKVEDGKPSEAEEAPKPEEAPFDYASIINADLGVKFEDGKIIELPRERGSRPKPAAKTPKKDEEEKIAEEKPVEDKPDKPESEKKEEAKIEVATDKDEEARLESRLSEVVDKALSKHLPKAEAKPEKRVDNREPERDPDAAFIETLDEDSQYEVELARYAEKKGKKGLAKETIGYLKAVTEYVEKHKDEEGRTFDESDEEFQKHIRARRPKISPTERRRIEMAYVAETVGKETEQRLRKELTPQIKAAEEKSRETEIRPRIESELKKFNDSLLNIEAPDDILKEVIETVKTKGDVAASEEDPIYGAIVQHGLNFGRNAAAEFMALDHQLKKPDPANATHKFLIEFLDYQGTEFGKNGGDLRVRTQPDGTKQNFLTRRQWAAAYAQDPEATVQNNWTFNTGEILDMIAIETQKVIKGNVSKAAEKFAKAGWGRNKPVVPTEKPRETKPKTAEKAVAPQKPTPKPANSDDDEPPTSPKLGGSTGPGAASNGNGDTLSSVYMDALVPGYFKDR